MGVFFFCGMLLIIGAIPIQGTGTEKCTSFSWFLAVRSNAVDVVQSCLDSGFPIESLDEVGCTAIVSAAANKHREILKQLVASGANVNAECKSGSTALSYAAKHNDIDAAEYLLSVGADQSRRGAVLVAAKHGFISMIKFLNGIGANLVETWTGNVLHWAAANNQDEQLRYMHIRGNHIDSKDIKDHTPLIMASREGVPITLYHFYFVIVH